MGWIVFGIIAFVVTLWVWRHTYTDREKVYERKKEGFFDSPPYHWEYKDEDRLAMPRWALLLLFVVYVFPAVNIVLGCIALYLFVHGLIDEDIYFHLKGNKFTKAMAEFFTKDVYAKKKSE